MSIEFLRPALHPPDTAERIGHFLLAPWREAFGSKVQLNRDLSTQEGPVASTARKILIIVCFILGLLSLGLLTLVGTAILSRSRSYSRASTELWLQKNQSEPLLQKARQEKDPLLAQMIQDFDRLVDPEHLSVQETEKIRQRTSDYKNYLFDKTWAPLYRLFKKRLSLVLLAKLPFRLIQEAKHRMRIYEREYDFKEYAHQETREFIEKLQIYAGVEKTARPSYHTLKTSLLPQVRQKALAEINQDSELETRAKILEKITWVHGTTSALLPFLPHSGFKLLPTGDLLKRGIAPMSGELGQGCFGSWFARGIYYDGINNKRLSGETLRNLPRAWYYASDQQFKFQPDALKLENIEKFLAETNWRYVDNWNKLNIQLLRLRQWDEPLFQKSVKESPSLQAALKQVEEKKKYILSAFQQLIATLGEDVLELQDDRDVKLPGYLEKNEFQYGTEQVRSSDYYLKEILAQIEEAKKNSPRLFNANRKAWAASYVAELERAENFWTQLQNAVGNPVTDLNEEARNWISKPFPLLIGSTSIIPKAANGSKSEYTAETLNLGQEADLLITSEDHCDELKNYLKKQGLEGRVAVYPSSVFENFPHPLIHRSDQVQLVE